MIGRSIVATTVRSSAATNTLNPTTARIAAGDGRRRAGGSGGEINHRCCSLGLILALAHVGRRLDRERVAVVVELERPVGCAAVDRRRELGRRHQVGVGMDPEVDGDVLTLHEPDGDVADLRRGGGAGDVVALAAAVVDTDHADVLEVGEQRLPAVLRVEELRGVDVVTGGQGLEVARDGVGDPHLVLDGDGAEACGEVVVDRHLELGLGLARDAELAA